MTDGSTIDHIHSPEVYAVLWFLTAFGMVIHIWTGNQPVYWATLTGLGYLSTLSTFDYFSHD